MEILHHSPRAYCYIPVLDFRLILNDDEYLFEKQGLVI